MAELHQIFSVCCLWPWLGFPLVASDMLSSSSFIDDVIFLIMGPVVCHIYTCMYFKAVRGWHATGYASQHIWCILSQARINWEDCARKDIRRKNGGDGRNGALISLDGVAVHLNCWCICLCYLHFAPENLKDGKMYLLVPAHPGCPGQSPMSCKMVVYVCEDAITAETKVLCQFWPKFC